MIPSKPHWTLNSKYLLAKISKLTGWFLYRQSCKINICQNSYYGHQVKPSLSLCRRMGNPHFLLKASEAGNLSRVFAALTACKVVWPNGHSTDQADARVKQQISCPRNPLQFWWWTQIVCEGLAAPDKYHTFNTGFYTSHELNIQPIKND